MFVGANLAIHVSLHVDRPMKKEQHFEWFGPHGTIGLIFSLPVTVYGLYLACHEGGAVGWDLSIPSLPKKPFLSLEGFVAYWGWLALTIFLHIVLPGDYQQGTKLSNGKVLTYKLNALTFFLLTIVASIVLSFGLNVLPLGWIFDHYLEMTTASIVTSFLLGFYLYFSSFRKGLLLTEAGTTGYPIYDWWLGRELNPRINIGSFSLDIKEFCELYPGLTLWVIIDIAMAYKQYELHGYVSNSMILVTFFHFLYILDAELNEKSILTTMDITTEGFGFMLAFGDLTWVPFTYTLQARYLVTNPVNLSNGFIVLILFLEFAGLYAFRASNGQKDQFRRDPNHPSVKHLKTLPTKRGTKLLISGWWGICRHPNYTADWTMAWAWCLCAGFGTPVTYFYVIYFGILLVHREMRDDHACQQKYGDDWKEYQKIVRYRLIPGLY